MKNCSVISFAYLVFNCGIMNSKSLKMRDYLRFLSDICISFPYF